jgi:hypothetical protein
MALLLPETAAVERAADGDEARELLLAVAALAHGHAVFLLERAFGPVEQALAATLERVEVAVRALLAAVTCPRPGRPGAWDSASAWTWAAAASRGRRSTWPPGASPPTGCASRRRSPRRRAPSSTSWRRCSSRPAPRTGRSG